MAKDFREEEALGKAYDGRLVRRLVRYLGPYRRAAVLTLVTLIASELVALVPPLIIRWAIDGPIAEKRMSALVPVAVALIAVFLARFVVGTATDYLGQMTAQKVMRDLRRDVFTHLQRMPYGFYDKNPTGRLMTRVTSDVGVINDFFASGVIAIIAGLFTVVATFGFMAALSWRLTLVATAMIPLLAGLGWFFSRGIRYSYRETRRHLARMNSYLQENLAGMSVVQLFNRERRNSDQYVGFNARYRDAQILTNFYFALYFPGVEFIGAVGVALVVWRGGGLYIDGAVTLGILVAFFSYSDRFFWPLREISEKYNNLQQAMASAERIFSLLDTPPLIVSSETAEPVRPLRHGIRLEEVWFAYDKEDYVLEDVSFEVRRGETVALVGATGSGKTTIINLLGRHYDVSRGRVTFDGIDVRELDLAAHRRRLALVAQDVFIFSGDVAANIRLGDETISDDRVMDAARAVNAHTFINRLEGDFHAPLGERGATLSVGQRQLLSFARALAFDPEVLLLDEATSSVDTVTEQLIQEALQRLMTGRTAIVVAHRLSTIQKADRIVVLHHGRVREIGTHDELIRAGGIYRRLYELQYRDQTNTPARMTGGDGNGSAGREPTRVREAADE